MRRRVGSTATPSAPPWNGGGSTSPGSSSDYIEVYRPSRRAGPEPTAPELPPDPFRLGINYWPARTAMRWWAMFEGGETAEDFARIAAGGFDSVRMFLLWEAFQPEADRVASTDARTAGHGGEPRRARRPRPDADLVHRAHEAGRLIPGLGPRWRERDSRFAWCPEAGRRGRAAELVPGRPCRAGAGVVGGPGRGRARRTWIAVGHGIWGTRTRTAWFPPTGSSGGDGVAVTSATVPRTAPSKSLSGCIWRTWRRIAGWGRSRPRRRATSSSRCTGYPCLRVGRGTAPTRRWSRSWPASCGGSEAAPTCSSRSSVPPIARASGRKRARAGTEPSLLMRGDMRPRTTSGACCFRLCAARAPPRAMLWCYSDYHWSTFEHPPLDEATARASFGLGRRRDAEAAVDVVKVVRRGDTAPAPMTRPQMIWTPSATGNSPASSCPGCGRALPDGIRTADSRGPPSCLLRSRKLEPG